MDSIWSLAIDDAAHFRAFPSSNSVESNGAGGGSSSSPGMPMGGGDADADGDDDGGGGGGHAMPTSMSGQLSFVGVVDICFCGMTFYVLGLVLLPAGDRVPAIELDLDMLLSFSIFLCSRFDLPPRNRT
jgi:hypothetical protein